jgi:hypothetical protein
MRKENVSTALLIPSTGRPTHAGVAGRGR